MRIEIKNDERQETGQQGRARERGVKQEKGERGKKGEGDCVCV